MNKEKENPIPMEIDEQGNVSFDFGKFKQEKSEGIVFDKSMLDTFRQAIAAEAKKLPKPEPEPIENSLPSAEQESRKPRTNLRADQIADLDPYGVRSRNVREAAEELLEDDL